MHSGIKYKRSQANLLWKLALIGAITTSGCGNESITSSQTQNLRENAGEFGLTNNLLMDHAEQPPLGHCDPIKDTIKLRSVAKPGAPFEFFVQNSKWSSAFTKLVSNPKDKLPGVKIYSNSECVSLQTLPWDGINQITLRATLLRPTPSATLYLTRNDGKNESRKIIVRQRTSARTGEQLLTGDFTRLDYGHYTLSWPGTDFMFEFYVLPGDVNGDYVVDLFDVIATQEYYGNSTSLKSIRFDSDANGLIDLLDVMRLQGNFGVKFKNPNPPQPDIKIITEVNKVHIKNEKGMVPGIISAAINGKVVAKAELSGKDAGLLEVTGPLGSKVIWTNSLNQDSIETILDGQGDYDGRGHYVTFKSSSLPKFNLPNNPLPPPSVNPFITELNKVHINNEKGMVAGIISAAIDGKVVAKAELSGKDAGLVEVTGPLGSKVIWTNSLNQDSIETTLDGQGDYDDRGHYVVFKVATKPEIGRCGRFFGVTAGSFDSTKDECLMSQEDIGKTCEKFAGEAYKITWTSFLGVTRGGNGITTELQNGVCKKQLPDVPPSLPPSEDDLRVDDGMMDTYIDVPFEINHGALSRSRFQVCVRVSANGQSEVELGCSQSHMFPPSKPTTGFQQVTLRMLAHECNVLKLTMYSKMFPGDPGKPIVTGPDRIFSTQNMPTFGPGIAVDHYGDIFKIMANDNGDSRWDDLELKVRSLNPQVRFLIDGLKTSTCQ